MIDVQPWQDVLPDVPPARGYRNRCLLKTTLRAIEREGLDYFQHVRDTTERSKQF